MSFDLDSYMPHIYIFKYFGEGKKSMIWQPYLAISLFIICYPYLFFLNILFLYIYILGNGQAIQIKNSNSSLKPLNYLGTKIDKTSPKANHQKVRTI